MRRILVLLAVVAGFGCADLRGASQSRCGTFGDECSVPVKSALVDAIAAAWAIELDPLYPTRGPFLIGAGGDSAWSVAVYNRLQEARPNYFTAPADTAHAAHLAGVTVEMLGDTAKVTTSMNQCTTRPTTFNWVENGMTHRFLEAKGQWALLPGSLGHLAQGKC